MNPQDPAPADPGQPQPTAKDLLFARLSEMPRWKSIPIVAAAVAVFVPLYILPFALGYAGGLVASGLRDGFRVGSR